MASSLTTTSLVQQHLGISTNDAAIAAIVSGINAGLENFLGKIFTETTYTNEEYDMPKDSRTLSLRHFPVISFTNLQYKDSPEDYSDTSWTSFDTSEYVVDFDSGLVTRNTTFSRGKRTIRATYSAGYSSVPADIQLAATILASSIFQNRKTMNITQETLGQYSRSFGIDPANWKKLGIDWIMYKYNGKNDNWFAGAYLERPVHSESKEFNQ